MVLDPEDEENRERWLNALSLATNLAARFLALPPAVSVTTGQQQVSCVKSAFGVHLDVSRGWYMTISPLRQLAADSVQDFDGLEIISKEGKVDEEREVMLRTTVCGFAILDGSDPSVVLAYYPHKLVKGCVLEKTLDVLPPRHSLTYDCVCYPQL
jgi:hypothetical protein